MSQLSNECKHILLTESIDADSNIEFDVNGESYNMSFEYIIDTFMLASSESQHFFVAAMKQAQKAGDLEKFFESMGELLLRTHLSEKLEV